VSEAARLMLLLALAGAGVTFLGSAATWLMDPQQRMQRSLKRVLKGWPDAMLLSPPSGRGAGFAFDSALLAVCWDNGAWCLIYRIDELAGAELLIDGQVVGRALRGEPSRVLDRAGGASESVVLRLIFDDPRHPDFDLDLWTRADQFRRVAASPSEAIAEANSWLARTEAILRKPRPVPPPAAPAVAAAAAMAGYDDDDEEDYKDFSPEPAPKPTARPRRPSADDDEDPELPF
jgi:hypothetical protein